MLSSPVITRVPEPLRTGIIARCSLPALLLAAVLLVPFFNKAYTIDDPIFLKGAAHVLHDPLHPTGFTMAWMTPYPAPASLFFSNSPLMFYLLVPAVAAGGAEWSGHLLMLCFFFCGIWGTVSLALRLGFTSREAVWSGILLAATPAALAMASTDMPDIPALTFGVLAVDRVTAWKQSQRWHDGLLGALLLTLGALSRPHVILLLAVCFLWLCEPGTKGNWRKRFWPVLLSPLLFVFSLHVTAAHTTGTVLEIARSFTAPRYIASDLFAYLNHFVWTLPFTIPWLLVFRKLTWGRIFGVLGPGAALAIASGDVLAGLVVSAAFLSVLVLFYIFRGAVAERDWKRLLLASWLLIPLPALAYIHLPSKYLVPCAPAVALLLVTGLRGSTQRLRKAVLIGTTAAGVLIGLLIVRADYNLAGALRQGVAQLISPRIARGEHVWFAGTWGFYWYAEQAGARPLSSRPPLPARGDVIVSAGGDGRYAEELRRYRLVEHISNSFSGGRIFGGQPPAGFYSNYYGYFPWGWGTGPLAVFEVRRAE